jgi:hypothetical protein
VFSVLFLFCFVSSVWTRPTFTYVRQQVVQLQGILPVDQNNAVCTSRTSSIRIWLYR